MFQASTAEIIAAKTLPAISATASTRIFSNGMATSLLGCWKACRAAPRDSTYRTDNYIVLRYYRTSLLPASTRARPDAIIAARTHPPA